MQKKSQMAMIGEVRYFGHLPEKHPRNLRDARIVGVCDLCAKRPNGEEKIHIPKIYSDLFSWTSTTGGGDRSKLTRPYVHFDVSYQALMHGKKLYTKNRFPPPLGGVRTHSWYSWQRRRGCIWGGAPGYLPGAASDCRMLIADG
jgi:hypothetical protein